MKSLIAALTLCLFSSLAFADVSLDITTVSKHFGTKGAELNEKNFGVGVKIGDAKGAVTLGTFVNSYGIQSQYAALSRELEGIDGNRRVRFGLAVGVVRGYEGTRGERCKIAGGIQCLAMPYVEIGSSRAVTRIGLVANAVTLQFSFKLRAPVDTPENSRVVSEM